jgi:hypothetical protein
MNKSAFKLEIKAPEPLFADGTLRREVLNAEWFTTTRQAQVVINGWLKQYDLTPALTRPSTCAHRRPKLYEEIAQPLGVRHELTQWMQNEPLPEEKN